MAIEVGEGITVTDPLMACERVVEEDYDVVVHFPRTWGELIDYCNSPDTDEVISEALDEEVVDKVARILGWALLFLIMIVIIVWITVVGNCQEPPWLILKEVNLRNIGVYHNATDMSYQLISSI